MTAGEPVRLHGKPTFDSEIACHFRNTATDLIAANPQVLKAECQLMPYFIRDDLLLRALHHIADAASAFAFREFRKGNALKAHAARLLAKRRQFTL